MWDSIFNQGRYKHQVSNTGSFELVAVPLGTERGGLKDWEVGSVNSNLANTAIILLKPVLPLNLKGTRW